MFLMYMVGFYVHLERTPFSYLVSLLIGRVNVCVLVIKYYRNRFFTTYELSTPGKLLNCNADALVFLFFFMHVRFNTLECLLHGLSYPFECEVSEFHT